MPLSHSIIWLLTILTVTVLMIIAVAFPEHRIRPSDKTILKNFRKNKTLIGISDETLLAQFDTSFPHCGCIFCRKKSH
jgi:hypothetical protein